MLESYIVYNIVLIIPAIIGLIMQIYNIKNIQRVVLILIAFLIIWFPSAIRYGIGGDYWNYVDIYHNLNDYYGSIEIGFFALASLLKNIGVGDQGLFIIIGFVTYLFVFLSIPKENWWAGILIFTCMIYLSSYSVMRQILAVSIVMYSATIWINGNKIKSMFFYAIAILFHYSMLIFLPVIVLSLLVNFNTSKSIFAIFAIFVIVYVFNAIDHIFNSALFLDSKYGAYVNTRYNQDTSGGLGLGVIIKLTIPFLVCCNASRILMFNKKYNLLVISTLAYILAVLLSTKIFIFVRLADVFSFVPILAAPLLFKITNKTLPKLFLTLIVLSYVASYEASIYANDISVNKSGVGLFISPYQSIFG